MEIIEKIEDYEDTSFWGRHYSGFKVTTNKQEIIFCINEGQSCCENYGYFSSHDDFSDFIGAELKDLLTVDDALDAEKYSLETDGHYEGNAIFLNFETSRGCLQFVVYNDHNGYYGHEVKIISNKINYNTTL